jgi:hypothetical protein
VPSFGSSRAIGPAHRLLLLVCAAAWFSASASAELPPDAYRNDQRTAPEALEIKVRTVTSSKARQAGETVVTNDVAAEVQKVVRSASGLKPRARIRIRYTQRIPDRPMVGPSRVPTLKRGQVCPAYLEQVKDGKSYAPAAGGYSFQTVPSG